MHFKGDHISDVHAINYLVSEAFAWALKIWFRLLVPSFPARSRRIQLPNFYHQFGLLSMDLHFIPCADFVETFN